MQYEFTKEELCVLDLVLINRLCEAKLYLQDHPHEDNSHLEEAIASLDTLHKKLCVFLGDGDIAEFL